ncbi:hypothetical protein ACRAWF_09060 [Streptomyces sp. L7]
MPSPAWRLSVVPSIALSQLITAIGNASKRQHACGEQPAAHDGERRFVDARRWACCRRLDVTSAAVVVAANNGVLGALCAVSLPRWKSGSTLQRPQRPGAIQRPARALVEGIV